MFGLTLFSASRHTRSGPSQIFSEFIATFGLMSVIWGCSRLRSSVVPFAVGAYITAAYWFTASTSFANPAVTLARAATNTFSGIRPADAPGFITAQLIGAGVATVLFRWLKTENTLILSDVTELQRRAESGNAIAQNNLAYRDIRGEEFLPDLTQATKLFAAAAAQGLAAAEYNLGVLYERGLGVAQDYATAGNYHRVAAEQGNALAQGRIGLLYENGWGIARSNSEAMKWYRAAAEQGEPSAQCKLAEDYLQGVALPQDYKQGEKWYRRAAEQGFGPAQLSRNYYTAYEEIRTLGLTASPAEKFAKLLLSWYSEKGARDGAAQITMTLTHEEIAEMIGTTHARLRAFLLTFSAISADSTSKFCGGIAATLLPLARSKPSRKLQRTFSCLISNRLL